MKPPSARVPPCGRYLGGEKSLPPGKFYLPPPEDEVGDLLHDGQQGHASVGILLPLLTTGQKQLETSQQFAEGPVGGECDNLCLDIENLQLQTLASRPSYPLPDSPTFFAITAHVANLMVGDPSRSTIFSLFLSSTVLGRSIPILTGG